MGVRVPPGVLACVAAQGGVTRFGSRLTIGVEVVDPAFPVTRSGANGDCVSAAGILDFDPAATTIDHPAHMDEHRAILGFDK
ncbi:MAG: hypothetical protein EBS83_03370 [Planctomycetia bacterium]|nr:hypothetical protein [Planctomycetia bacterium]